jgi:hypothetical protein
VLAQSSIGDGLVLHRGSFLHAVAAQAYYQILVDPVDSVLLAPVTVTMHGKVYYRIQVDPVDSVLLATVTVTTHGKAFVGVAAAVLVPRPWSPVVSKGAICRIAAIKVVICFQWRLEA